MHLCFQDGGVLVLNSFRDSPEALSAEFVQALLRCGFDITMKDQVTILP